VNRWRDIMVIRVMSHDGKDRRGKGMATDKNTKDKKTVKTIFPNEHGKIYLLCPCCNANTLKPAKLFPIHESIRINCPCGHSYEFIIENRKTFRKKTSLPSIFWKTDSPDAYHNGTICDLTLDGCLLLASDKHSLHQGEHIKMAFKLDNPERTKIVRKALIRRIKENYIGCQFLGTPAFDPELGFYVQDFKVPK